MYKTPNICVLCSMIVIRLESTVFIIAISMLGHIEQGNCWTALPFTLCNHYWIFFPLGDRVNL